MSNPERLAYWYFRLNGFLTTENFLVHPDHGAAQRTDADLLGVRFRHRSELLVNSMEDDARVASCATLANVIIAEVKRGVCCLNESWTNRTKANVPRALRSIGCVDEAILPAACDDLYRRGRWEDNQVTVRVFAVGEEKNSRLSIPLDQQLTWDDIVEFMCNRFAAHRNIKSSNGQWPDEGRALRTAALSANARNEIRSLFLLRSEGP